MAATLTTVTLYSRLISTVGSSPPQHHRLNHYHSNTTKSACGFVFTSRVRLAGENDGLGCVSFGFCDRTTGAFGFQPPSIGCVWFDLSQKRPIRAFGSGCNLRVRWVLVDTTRAWLVGLKPKR
nr:hypothetical protein [Tanacetum cinerariifolium]GEZ79483.1 hypothetical protein [Tanacetum cinerariifolium]